MMLYIAENLKNLRKEKSQTQEEVAEILGVSAQSVSKWERGDTMPDITLLPSLANLYQTSVDALLGMDRINDRQTKNAIFIAGHGHLRSGDTNAAIKVYTEALKTYPNDEDIMSDLAMSLALDSKGPDVSASDATLDANSSDAGVPDTNVHNGSAPDASAPDSSARDTGVRDAGNDRLSQAVALCERVLSGYQGEKVHHTTRAALCFIYMKAGERDKAITTARKLPHTRESREVILAQLEKEPSTDDIDTFLKFIAIGEIDEQDVIEISFGENIVPIFTQAEDNVLTRIKALRDEIEAPETNAGYRKLPPIRIKDNIDLAPDRLRLRHYADYLLDKVYANPAEAGDDILETLRKMAEVNTVENAKTAE